MRDQFEISFGNVAKSERATLVGLFKDVIAIQNNQLNWPECGLEPLIEHRADVQAIEHDNVSECGVTVRVEIVTWTSWWQWPWRLFWLPVRRAATAEKLARATVQYIQERFANVTGQDEDDSSKG